LQREVDLIVEGFSRQSGAFSRYLTPGELAALRANPNGLGPASFGKAVERALFRKIDDSAELSEGFATAGGPGRWDVSGRGKYEGLTFEVTTRSGIPRHADRWYGETAEYITYDRPADYLFWVAD
jgi:hypothetical protein